MSDPSRIFDAPASTVLAAVDCTWCGSDIGEECTNRYGVRETVPHAQRWRDYWNATHDKAHRVEVFADPKPGFRWLPDCDGGQPIADTMCDTG